MKKNNKINLKINYISNIKPNSNLKIKKLKYKNSKIFCKNFIFFILLLNYSRKNNNLNIKLFIKKNKIKSFTILRPPYRHKLSRHQICIKRYNLILKILIPLNRKIIITNINKFYKILYYVKKYFS